MTHSWTTRSLDPNLREALVHGVPASRLWSLLLEVMEQRAADRTPANLLEQWTRDRFVAPSYIDQRTSNAVDGHLLAAAVAFEAIELSPLAPLGSCAAVGLASQNKIVSALRGTEVVSDPTNILALECARRLQRDPEQTVRLTTSHRCVRAQEVPKQPGFAAHFRMFCLASAGRERPDHGFTVSAVVEQITTLLGALDRLEQHGYEFPERKVALLTTAARAAIGERIAAVVGVPVTRGALEHPYYDGVRFQINARSARGEGIPLIDGGAFRWVGKLAANNRLAFVASGMGSQLVPYLYRR